MSFTFGTDIEPFLVENFNIQSTIGKYLLPIVNISLVTLVFTLYHLFNVIPIQLLFLMYLPYRFGDSMYWFDCISGGVRVSEDCTFYDESSQAIVVL